MRCLWRMLKGLRSEVFEDGYEGEYYLIKECNLD